MTEPDTTEASIADDNRPSQVPGTLALALAASLAVLSVLALSPFLSTISHDLNTSVALLGQALTATSILGAVLGLLLGPIAESLGYKRLLLFGLLSMAASTMGTALVPSFPLLLVAQLVGGFSGATVTPMAFAIVSRQGSTDDRRRGVARIYTSSSIGMIVGFPILTSLAEWQTWRWSFALLGISALCVATITALTVDKDLRVAVERPNFRSIIRSYRPILEDRVMRMLLSAQFCRGVGWSGVLAYVGAFLMDELGTSQRVPGFVWLVVSPGFMLGSIFVGRWLRGFRPNVLFAFAALGMATLIPVVLTGQPPLVVVFAVLFVTSVFGGIAEVVAAGLIASDTPAGSGITMALHSSTIRLGSALGALLGGVLLALGGYQLMGIGLAVLPVLAATAAILARPVRVNA